MGKLYRSREGDVTAVDTKTQLATLGSEAAPGPLLVPANAKELAAIHVAFAGDFAAANDSAVFVRIEGPALPEGPETVVVGALGVAVATGGQSSTRAIRIPLAIPVVSANELLIFAEMAGEDTGTIRVGVTAEFDV